MKLITELSIGLVALMHCLFMILEMFLWRTSAGQRITGYNADMALRTHKLAANQGLYNGFLASGLVWSLMTNDNTFELRLFFLLCVIVAGVFGAVTISRTIFFVQAVPAIFALILLLLG